MGHVASGELHRGRIEQGRELIVERTRAGLASARARGRVGGRKPKMTAAKVRLAMASMGKRETNVAALCEELGITRQTLYGHVAPDGTLRADGKKARDPSREVESSFNLSHGRAQLP